MNSFIINYLSGFEWKNHNSWLDWIRKSAKGLLFLCVSAPPTSALGLSTMWYMFREDTKKGLSLLLTATWKLIFTNNGVGGYAANGKGVADLSMRGWRGGVYVTLLYENESERVSGEATKSIGLAGFRICPMGPWATASYSINMQSDFDVRSYTIRMYECVYVQMCILYIQLRV